MATKTGMVCVQTTGSGKDGMQSSFDGTCPSNWQANQVHLVPVS